MFEKTKIWIKDKWVRFKKWMIAIFGISAVLAAPALFPAPEMIPVDNTIVIYQDIKELPAEEQQGKYVVSERSFDSIQFEKLRKKIDPIYNEAHDAVSAAYYDGYEFIWQGKNYGILDKETFNKFQGKFWAEYEVMFHEENLKQKKKDRIPEEKYNQVCNELEGEGKDQHCIAFEKKSDKAQEKIDKLKLEKIDIELQKTILSL